MPPARLPRKSPRTPRRTFSLQPDRGRALRHQPGARNDARAGEQFKRRAFANCAIEQGQTNATISWATDPLATRDCAWLGNAPLEGGQHGVATGGGGVWADGSLVWACSRRAATPARRSPPRKSWPRAGPGFSVGCIPLAAGMGHLRRMRHWMRHQPGPCGVIMGGPVGLSWASAGFRAAPACAGRPLRALKK